MICSFKARHCWHMYLRTFEICVLKYMDLALLDFLRHQPWQAALKKIKVKLDILTDINMLLMVEKDIRGRICHGIHQYVKGNNKFMKDYDKNKELLYLTYCDVNNLYG